MYTDIPALLTNTDIVTLAPAAGSQKPIRKASERYSFVSTLSVVDSLREVGWFPINAEQSRAFVEKRFGYQQHMIRFIREGASNRDERIDMLLWNSHDLGSAFQLITSVFRKVCSNGLMVSHEYTNFIHKHIGFTMEQLIESALSIAESVATVSDEIESLRTIALEPEERTIFAESALRLMYLDIKESPINAEDLLVPRRSYDDKKDLWTTLNVIQENILKGGLDGQRLDRQGKIRRVKTRPVKSINRDVKLNKALWYLMEEMKKLKAA